MVENPQTKWNVVKADIRLVFPQNHGWAMRWTEDKILGIFQAEEEQESFGT
jgi:hypothetical protein